MAGVTWLFSLTVSRPAASWMQGSCQSAADPCRDLSHSDKVPIDPSVAPLTGSSLSRGNKQVKY